MLYRSAVEMVPTDDFQLPLSSAEVLQEGSDLTIVSWGPPLYQIETVSALLPRAVLYHWTKCLVLKALHMLKSPPPDLEPLIPRDMRGLSVELIDLRTIQPYDVSAQLSLPSVCLAHKCLA